jgi:small subunit ribosomal protein S6
MFILDPNRYAKEASGVSGELATMIEKLGGEVMVSRLWNEQKLAYPIDGHRKGTYWLTFFRMESTKLTQLNRECQLNGNILRHLTIKVDPRLVDALVSHARGDRPLRRVEETAAVAVGGPHEALGEEQQGEEQQEEGKD